MDVAIDEEVIGRFQERCVVFVYAIWGLLERLCSCQ